MKQEQHPLTGKEAIADVINYIDNFDFKEESLGDFILNIRSKLQKIMDVTPVRESMRWVKASEENFPALFAIFHYRDAKTKYPITASVAYSWARKGLYDKIEWLEETVTPVDLVSDEDSWKQLREKFFNECTEERYYDSLTGPKGRFTAINMTPHNLFEWFKQALTHVGVPKLITKNKLINGKDNTNNPF
jgi:hypothetical protein